MEYSNLVLIKHHSEAAQNALQNDEGKGDDAPGEREFKTRNDGKRPDRDASECAQERAYHHVFAKLGCDLSPGL